MKLITTTDELAACCKPLADTEFNRCKSDLSFVEAAARATL